MTLLNQLAKRYLPEAPRLDVLGLRLATAAFHKAGIEPRGFSVKIVALIGDLVSNSIFYGLVGLANLKPLRPRVRQGRLMSPEEKEEEA